MTDHNSDKDDEQAFTDTVDPYQARNGRREALGYAMGLINRDYENANDLVNYADTINSYLEDGSVPDQE